MYLTRFKGGHSDFPGLYKPVVTIQNLQEGDGTLGARTFYTLKTLLPPRLRLSSTVKKCAMGDQKAWSRFAGRARNQGV